MQLLYWGYKICPRSTFAIFQIQDYLPKAHCGRLQEIATNSSHHSMHTPFKSSFSVPPIQRWNLSCHSWIQAILETRFNQQNIAEVTIENFEPRLKAKALSWDLHIKDTGPVSMRTHHPVRICTDRQLWEWTPLGACSLLSWGLPCEWAHVRPGEELLEWVQPNLMHLHD